MKTHEIESCAPEGATPEAVYERAMNAAVVKHTADLPVTVDDDEPRMSLLETAVLLVIGAAVLAAVLV